KRSQLKPELGTLDFNKTRNRNLRMSDEANNGTLPEGWNSIQLGNDETAKTSSGGTPSRSKPDYFKGNIKWVKSGELNDNLIFDTEEKISEIGLAKSSAKLFPPDTLLIALYGATAGRTAILKTEAATNQAVCAIFPKNNSFDSEFLQYQLIFQRPKILGARSGGAQPNISQRVLGNLEITLPPLPEQKAIAKVLRSVQEAKEARAGELRLERERKNALMDYLFTRGARGESLKQTEIGEMPESWEVARLGEMITLQRGKDLPIQDRVKGDIPIVGSNGIVGFHNQTANMPIPCVATGRSGSIGLITYVDKPYWALNTALYVSDYKANHPLFIYYWLHLFDFKRYAEGASVPTLNRNKVHPVKFRLPTIEEQKEIAEVLQACDEKISALENETSLLDEFFKAMLEELMSGNLRTLSLC
ncbi:MAG: restriction endonuclease subunit S, partial [Pyrinomonadaceae bacterium]